METNLAAYYTAFLLLILFTLALWLYFHVKRDITASPIDLITNPDGRLSAAKIGQFIGMIVSTWVVVKMTGQQTLTFDIFAIYLTYIAATDGFTKFLRFKTMSSQNIEVMDEKIEIKSHTKSAPEQDLPRPPRDIE